MLHHLVAFFPLVRDDRELAGRRLGQPSAHAWHVDLGQHGLLEVRLRAFGDADHGLVLLSALDSVERIRGSVWRGESDRLSHTLNSPTAECKRVTHRASE